MRSPILAAVLSLIVAGLGQIYNGQVTKGVLFIGAQPIDTALTVDYDIKVENRPRLDSARCQPQVAPSCNWRGSKPPGFSD